MRNPQHQVPQKMTKQHAQTLNDSHSPTGTLHPAQLALKRGARTGHSRYTKTLFPTHLSSEIASVISSLGNFLINYSSKTGKWTKTQGVRWIPEEKSKVSPSVMANEVVWRGASSHQKRKRLSKESEDAEEVSWRQIIMRSLKHLVKLLGRTLKGSRERFDHIKKKKKKPT